MPKKPTQQTPMTREEVEQLVASVVKKELAGLLSSLEAQTIPRGRSPMIGVTKRTFSIPKSLWREFKTMFPKEGTASAHIASALRLYLAAHKKGQS